MTIVMAKDWGKSITNGSNLGGGYSTESGNSDLELYLFPHE